MDSMTPQCTRHFLPFIHGQISDILVALKWELICIQVQVIVTATFSSTLVSLIIFGELIIGLWMMTVTKIRESIQTLWMKNRENRMMNIWEDNERGSLMRKEEQRLKGIEEAEWLPLLLFPWEVKWIGMQRIQYLPHWLHDCWGHFSWFSISHLFCERLEPKLMHPFLQKPSNFLRKRLASWDEYLFLNSGCWWSWRR